MWECAELFLKVGGSTMVQIWSNHSYDDDDTWSGNGSNDIWSGDNDNVGTDNANDAVFTLKTLISYQGSGQFFLPHNLVKWLSYQPGTQEQLTKMVKSKNPLSNDEWAHKPESLRRLFLFMHFSRVHHYNQPEEQLQRPREELNLQQQLIPQRDLPSSSGLQSLSWLQSLIVYAPIDHTNIKFTLRLWKDNPNGCNFALPLLELIGDDIPMGLCHSLVLMDKLSENDDSPALVLEELVEGVIIALLTNHQQNDDQQ